MTTDHHVVFRRALGDAAVELEAVMNREGTNAVREKHFRQVLRVSLEKNGESCAQEVRPDLPGWPNIQSGKLGGFDLAVVAEDGHSMCYLAELKWCSVNKLWETLWDVLKVSAATAVESVEAVYVIAGAPAKLWEKPADCAELFADGAWSTRELISRYSTNWSWLLGEGSISQPVLLPALLRTELVGSERIELKESTWEIRAIAVRPISAEEVAFEHGWPVQGPVHAADDELAEQIRRLKQAVSLPLPENLLAWRFFESPLLYKHVERLKGLEIQDLGFTDLTALEDIARQHLPAAHPVLALVMLPQGTVIAPTALVTDGADADLLLAPGTRFRIAQVVPEVDLLNLVLEIADH